ncbi:MAG: hypothetical protein FWF34_01755 [Alphaproteobacteria bacterium]|nr:hypothetical protein [Alphaproteobacteria bacterium]MCL2889959.1 hypothetical protein [Alphaproteobacteria bacterium]
MPRNRIETLSALLRLTPYQSYILSVNHDRYDLEHLQKRGNVLYAPYKCGLCKTMWESIVQFFTGPRADLIGAEKVLVIGQRGIRLYAAGFYKACDPDGHYYYATQTGERIERNVLENILGL